MRVRRVGFVIAVTAIAQKRDCPDDSSGIFYLTVPRAGTYGLVFVTGLALPQSAGKVRVGAKDFHDATYVVTMEPEVAFIDKELDKHAAAYPDNKLPRYPDSLRTANVEGDVLAEFVVGRTSGPSGRGAGDDAFSVLAVAMKRPMRFAHRA